MKVREAFSSIAGKALLYVGAFILASSMPAFAQDYPSNIKEQNKAKLRVYSDTLLPTTGEFSPHGGMIEIDAPEEPTLEQKATALSEETSQFPITHIMGNGNTKNGIGFMTFGDGYTAAEMSKYAQVVDEVVKGMFMEEPFASYKNFFNVYRMDVVSNESGIDHPEKSEYKNTALDGTYACAQLSIIQSNIPCIDFTKSNELLKNIDPKKRDKIIVLLNNVGYYTFNGAAFGIDGTYTVISHPDLEYLIKYAWVNILSEVALHETGHLFGLADEYSSIGKSDQECLNSPEPVEPNLTKIIDRSLIKWNVGGGPPNGWVEPNTQIPTCLVSNTFTNDCWGAFPYDPNIVGLYEGGGYCIKHIFRPTFESKMSSIDYPFGPVNEEALIKKFYKFVSPIESSNPADNNITIIKGQNQAFNVTPIKPTSHSLNTTWYLNGIEQGQGEQFNIDTKNLTLGNYKLEAVVIDPTTKVRNDPTNQLLESRVWNVTIGPKIGPELTGTWATTPIQKCKNKKGIQTCSIKGTFYANNQGNRDSTPTVNIYLSDNDTYDMNDTQLTSITPGIITPNTTKNVKIKNVYLPQGVSASGKNLIAIISEPLDTDQSNNEVPIEIP